MICGTTTRDPARVRTVICQLEEGHTGSHHGEIKDGEVTYTYDWESPLTPTGDGHLVSDAGEYTRLPDFDGDTYERPRDHVRLGKQARRVWGVLRDGNWHTLSEISQATGDPEASVSARIRDLRKAKFGGNEVEHEFLGAGLWRYRLLR